MSPTISFHLQLYGSFNAAMQVTISLTTSRRMDCVRRVFHYHRRARKHRQLWLFYLEHNLFEQASDERSLMIEQLRCARDQWRLALGWP